MNKIRTDIAWTNLSMKELAHIAQMEQQHSEEEQWKQKLELWMTLTGTKLAEHNKEDMLVSEEWEQMFQFYANGNKDDVFVATRQDMVAILSNELKFLEFPTGGKDEKTEVQYEGLVQLPNETIRIGHKTFKLPEPLITNLTYEQYNNVQKLSQLTFNLTEQLRNGIESLEKSGQRLEKARQSLEAKRVAGADCRSQLRKLKICEQEMHGLIKQVNDTSKELHKNRSRVVSHLITSRKLQFVSGNGLGTHIDIHWTWPYSAEMAERRTKYISKHAPVWLYDVLQQNLQSCLSVYKEQFPDLFSGGDDDGSNKLPLISEMDSINAVMKWQGYKEQQNVYDTNAVLVFSILNSMTKEAKAIEEANAKIKSHRT